MRDKLQSLDQIERKLSTSSDSRVSSSDKNGSKKGISQLLSSYKTAKASLRDLVSKYSLGEEGEEEQGSKSALEEAQNELEEAEFWKEKFQKLTLDLEEERKKKSPTNGVRKSIIGK